jgi:hypothetical protein
MLEAGGEVVALGTEWLLNYLIHSSVLITAAWLAVRTGRVRAPESQDLPWNFTALAGIVTATAVVLPRTAPQAIRLTASVELTETRCSCGGSTWWALAPGRSSVTRAVEPRVAILRLRSMPLRALWTNG